MTAQAHRSAVLVLLKAAASAVRVLEVEAPSGTPMPYVVLHIGPGVRSRSTHKPVSDRRDVEFTLTCVGLDPAGMFSAQERASAAILDRRPAVTGRSSSTITQIPGGGDVPRWDRDVTPERLYVVDAYSFFTTPAPTV